MLKEAGKLGQIKVIGFDEDPITLGGVKEGTIVGTVVQQPYEWGYQGMKLMAKYLEGDKSGIPANGLIIIPTKIIDQSNVDAFWAELKSAPGPSKPRPDPDERPAPVSETGAGPHRMHGRSISSNSTTSPRPIRASSPWIGSASPSRRGEVVGLIGENGAGKIAR